MFLVFLARGNFWQKCANSYTFRVLLQVSICAVRGARLGRGPVGSGADRHCAAIVGHVCPGNGAGHILAGHCRCTSPGTPGLANWRGRWPHDWLLPGSPAILLLTGRTLSQPDPSLWRLMGRIECIAGGTGTHALWQGDCAWDEPAGHDDRSVTQLGCHGQGCTSGDPRSGHLLSLRRPPAVQFDEKCAGWHLTSGGRERGSYHAELWLRGCGMWATGAPPGRDRAH